MACFHSLHHHEHVLSAHVFTHCSLGDVFQLGAASAGCRKVFQQGCQLVRVCVVPPRFRHTLDTSQIVDAWYGTNFENDKEFHSFPAQGWSQRSLTAKVALNKDAWDMCCAAFLAGSLEEFHTEVCRCLRCILWLVAEIHLERFVELRVPLTSAESARKAAFAFGQLRGPVTLGMACWEEKCVDKDWMGNSYAWWWGCCSSNDDAFADGLIPQRPVDMSPSELNAGFRFVDENGRELLGRNEAPSFRRELFQNLPRIQGLFEHCLSPVDLFCISADARQSLTRLGCLYISGIAAIPSEIEWASLGSFDRVGELSVQIQDFYCGSDAWPPAPCCRRNSRCAAAAAKKLSAFLRKVFPSVHRVSFFFEFPYGEPAPYPTPGVTAMMHTLVSDFKTQIARPIDIDVGILGIWQLDLDSLDSVDALCQSGWRRERLLQAYEYELEGGFHS